MNIVIQVCIFYGLNWHIIDITIPKVPKGTLVFTCRDSEAKFQFHSFKAGLSGNTFLLPLEPATPAKPPPTTVCLNLLVRN